MSAHRARASVLAALVALFILAPRPAAQGDPPRDTWQRVGDIVEALGVGPGSHVADVGAGDGYFTLRLARIVGPAGRVYAVDVSASQLQRLRDRVSAAGLDNVEIIQGAQDDPRLPGDRLDAVLVVNAYHEFEQPGAMLNHIATALRDGGRLVLVEPIARGLRGAARADQVRTHNLDAAHAEADLRAAGYQVRRLEDPFTVRPGGRDEEWLLLASPAGASVDPVPTAPPATDAVVRVERAEFERLLDAAAITVVDVRSEGEFAAGHIPGARSVPLERIVGRAPDLREAGKPIVTYCS